MNFFLFCHRCSVTGCRGCLRYRCGFCRLHEKLCLPCLQFFCVVLCSCLQSPVRLMICGSVLNQTCVLLFHGHFRLHSRLGIHLNSHSRGRHGRTRHNL